MLSHSAEQHGDNPIISYFSRMRDAALTPARVLRQIASRVHCVILAMLHSCNALNIADSYQLSQPSAYRREDLCHVPYPTLPSPKHDIGGRLLTA